MFRDIVEAARGDVYDLIRSMDGNMELRHAIAIADSAEWWGDMSVNLHTAIKAARIMSRELENIRAAID